MQHLEKEGRGQEMMVRSVETKKVEESCNERRDELQCELLSVSVRGVLPGFGFLKSSKRHQEIQLYAV